MASPLPFPVTIRPATQSDLSAMIAITCAATSSDVLDHFLYSPYHVEATRLHTAFLTASLSKRFTEPTNPCFLFKAVAEEEKEDGGGGGGGKDVILGWCLVRWEDGTWLDTPLAEGDGFTAVYERAVKEKWRGILKERGKHVVLGAVYVKPERQRQGIGRQLIEYIYDKYDLDKETVILQTRAMSEGFYLKLGWVTVDSLNIDLGEWGGKGMGYGVHRSPQMIRYPKT